MALEIIKSFVLTIKQLFSSISPTLNSLQESAMSLQEVQRFIQEPFPEEGTFKDEIKGNIGIGLFIFLFLYLFRPFGLEIITSFEAVKVCLFFGMLTILVSTLFHAFRRFVLKIECDKPSWTLGRWLLSTGQLIFLISIANFLLLSFGLNYVTFSWQGFMWLIYSTFLIGIFPVAFSGILKVHRNSRKFQERAKNLDLPAKQSQNQSKPVDLKTDQGIVTMNLNDFLFAESAQNYVSLFSEDNPKALVIRSSLSKIEEQLAPHGIVRIHRSFLVNPTTITKITGNAQGLKLQLKGTATIVPVSRKYIDVIEGR